MDFTTVPLFAVLLLLATRCIDGDDLRRGIVGEGGVEPLSIMALFISLVRDHRFCSSVFGAEASYSTFRLI